MAASLLQLDISLGATITKSVNGEDVSTREISTPGLVAVFSLTPDNDFDLTRKLGICRLTIQSDSENLPNLSPMDMAEFLRKAMVTMIESEGMKA